MRSLGIVQLGGLVLGPAPVSSSPLDPAEVKERERVSRIAKFRADYELEWGHTGGCPYTEEQIEAILTGKARP